MSALHLGPRVPCSLGMGSAALSLQLLLRALVGSENLSGTAAAPAAEPGFREGR